MENQACSRSEKIKEFAAELLEKRFEENATRILSEVFEKNTDTDYYKNLKQAFIEACNKCVKKQENNEKKKIAYVGVHFLKSSMITNSHDLYINFYDRELYVDRNETYAIWSPKEILKYYEEDAKFFESNISKKIVRPTFSEIQEIKMNLYGDYLKIVEQVFKCYVFKLVELEEFASVKKDVNYAVFFSPYMEMGMPLCIGRGE